MNKGVMIVSIMRPENCWTLLHVSILAALLITVNADGEDECEFYIKVPRNTYEASLGDELRISCTVKFCDDSPPPVSWFKLGQDDVFIPINDSSHRLKEEWQMLNNLEGVSFLIFPKFFSNDSGDYRCESESKIGNRINVNVTDSTTSSPPFPKDLMMYVYPAAGIVGFVIIVIIISVASMQGCKGKSKRTQEENQYVAIPMSEQPSQSTTAQPSPRGNPHIPPSQRSTRRPKAPPQLSESPVVSDNECVYSFVKDGRQRQTKTAEEGSLVYAALNHQLPARVPARPRRPKEESSEYAAIRVRDSNCS
ncbi:B- and T-lymphocyte attenuator-like [Xyrichtys novacula]|uniref:B- and T-lymphocyte attenuator-like n=1 Tax=Xyrichtys novacula TaxID=13765 RepID=A0AAV1HNU5_XYRNO|nr:B- and T-lymphocyte attenuator-like [Xyrichtys novacula]